MSSFKDHISGLEYLDGYDFPTYYSPGYRERAITLSKIASNCHHYIQEYYHSEIPITLLVLNESDWHKKRSVIYGFIQGSENIVWYPTDKEENPIYSEMIPLYENSPSNMKQRLSQLLPDSKNSFLTACLMWWETYMIHEMFHNYSKADGVRIKLRWFDELFGDFINYAFLKRYASQYKKELEVVELYYPILFQGGLSLVQYKTLDDFESLFVQVGGANYCWYHGWFNLGVFKLYEKYGEDFITKINNLYKSESGFDSTSEQLVSRLDLELEGFRDWYSDWIKQEA